MRLFLITSSLLQASKAERCTEADCSESATLLQFASRDRKVQTAGHQHKNQVSMLYESAVRLLREGATPEVQAFSKESLKQISGPVKTSIFEAHTSDEKRIKELFPKFEKVINDYEKYQSEVLKKRAANAVLSENHKSCRETQATLCRDHGECRTEEKTRWNTYLESTTNFQKVLTTDTDACTDATKNVTKDSIATFQEILKQIKEQGKTTVTEWQSHHDKMVECNGIQKEHSDKKDSCDAEQRDLEQAICANHQLHQLSRAEALNEWALVSWSWTTLTKAVKEEEKLRKNEFAAVHEVECILKNIEKRGGQPCSAQKDSDGNDEADKVMSHCRDETVDLSNWTIAIPQTPAEPVPPEDLSFPCSPTFEDEHYGKLKGDCHEIAKCRCCDDADKVETKEVETHEPDEGEECVSGVLKTNVDFTASHTVRFRLRMPSKDSVDDKHQRQWLFSADKDAGAEHWLWSPTGQFGESKHGHIQFGRWGGPGQIQDFKGSDDTKSDILGAHSLTAVYDADTEKYTLYMNGQEKQSIDGVKFSMDEKKLYVGVIPGAPEAETHGDQSQFTGCIEKVQIFHQDLSSSEVDRTDSSED